MERWPPPPEEEKSLCDVVGEGPESPGIRGEVSLPRLVRRVSSSSRRGGLLEKLKDLYHEQLIEGARDGRLLGRLMERESFNAVVVTLHPPDEGFSVAFLLESGKTLEEEARYPYSQDALLDYLDKEQLPTPFLEYWQNAVPDIFYDGCVICKVEDGRHGSPPIVRHVLLRPHTHSLVGDVASLTEDILDPEERFAVESRLINSSERALCLDPDRNVGRRLLKLHRDRHAFDTTSVRRLLRCHSPLLKHIRCKYEHLAQRPNPALADFIRSKRREEHEIIRTNPIPPLTNNNRHIPGREIMAEVSLRARSQEHQAESDDFTPRTVKEWVLENKADSSHVRLSVLQRPADSEYLGQIYLDNRHSKESGRGGGCLSRFTLGTRNHTHAFVNQYIELCTAGRGKTLLSSVQQQGPIHQHLMLQAQSSLPPRLPQINNHLHSTNLSNNTYYSLPRLEPS